MNEVPIQQFYALPYDRWEGYEADRQRVLNGLQGVKNVVFLTTGLVGAARATTAGGDESYHGNRGDHRENSDCDPGFSADRHRLSPFVGQDRS